MRRSKRTEVLSKSSGQHLKDHNIGSELTSAWKGLAHSKAALRHIENKLEAGPGNGVLLECIMDPTKKTRCRGDHSEDSSKRRGHSHHSPEKSTSRSPLRNCTQDNTVRNSVEFRDPLASYREATPPPRPSSPPDLYSLQSVPGSSYSSLPSNSNPVLGHLVYQRDTRDKQTDRNLDSTHSSALESMEVRYLNDQPALDTLRTNLSHTREATQTDGPLKAQQSMDSKGSTSISIRRGESTPSSSPGSASQRLENLRRHQPDDKLEKLKERIRKQRQHLEEAAEKDKPCYFEQPIIEHGKSGTSNKVRVRKVATAPPAPVYKGFNGTETKIQTPDGKIWNEEDFHNLSREMYKDLSRQFAETTKSQLQKEQRDLSKERRFQRPVRKVQKVGPVSNLNAKPVISPASWREGQKLVNMVLGPVPRVTNEESQTTKGQSQKASSHRSSSGPFSKSNRPTRPQITERTEIGSEIHNRAKVKESALLPVSKDMLSADIQGILDDLQLDCKTSESPERARPRSLRGTSRRRGRGGSGSRTRDPVSVWGSTSATRVCRSVSPTSRSKSAKAVEAEQKRRHYDADTVRQYIAQQQEKRKRCQAEEKKTLREEAEKRNKRLQELYRKQREVAKTVAASTEVSVGPSQQRLQETFNKLLLEGAQLGQRPLYQPSGESDKENKRLDPSQSPSSSDRSLNNPPLTRTDLVCRDVSSARLGHVNLDVHSKTSPRCSNEHLLSQLLRLETALAASEKHMQRPATAPNLSQAKMSRIESLKATATSLSNRIESEARKLAGEGLNYGLTTAEDVIILAPRSSHTDGDGTHWIEEAVNQPESVENENTVLNIERILGVQHSSYNGTGLLGKDMNSLKGWKEKKTSHLTHPSTSSAHQPITSYSHDREGLLNGTDINERLDKIRKRKNVKHPDHHDISSGSISEGPLSDGSLSDCEPSPARPTNVFRPIGHREAVLHSTRKSHQRLAQFQKDAEQCSAINPLLSHQENPKPAWEEFNKGSPLSVINIFARNLQENIKVSDRSLEKDSPSAHSLPSGNKVTNVYENDFASTHSSEASGQMDSTASSASNHFEELLRRSTEMGHSNSHHASVISPRSSGSTHHSSPHSNSSTKKGGKVSDHSDATLVEEPKGSPASEALSSASNKKDSVYSHTTEGDVLGLSHQSSDMDKNVSPPSKLRLSSPVEVNSSSVPLRSSSPEREARAGNTVFSGLAECRASGELQYSPAVLQQRLASEFHYLESIEESVRQLSDIERLMGVSMAQHESASLAQMLKAKQQQHEHELYELKIQTEREALETRLQMEENRQILAQAHIDLQESLGVTPKEALEGLQEATTKMMSQQAEAAQYTADTARHIKEMTEMAHAQLTTLKHYSAPHTSSDILKKEHSSHEKRSTDRANVKSYVSSRRNRFDEPQSALSNYSHSDSISFRSSELGGTSCHIHSPSNVSSECKDGIKTEAAEGKRKMLPSKDRMDRDEGCTSIEDEVPTAANVSLCSDTVPSAVEEKGDTTSVATEYSLKFDESITEDEIEERSFRSLLPSEAHRRGSLDKKVRHHDESEEDGASHSNTSISAPQDVNTAFSGGQDSFSQFTMEMVRQYMKDEEVRLQHQSSLLHLRQKALKEKTRTELAWLEHQKKKLRDKGEDDKMPPIRKKQRGLLLKLQQEQAEIKRLQEANKAARKERLLLLKQQEEIERMRSSTLKLKERLRCAASQAPSETSLSEAVSSNLRDADGDIRSPSPSVSVSGSETSSIMQKLKKMRSQMDEKFLTKREQQLMQRRHHAEELLQWKQRLDHEEAEVRKIEKKALAVWDRQTSQNIGHDISESEKDITTSPGQRKKDFACEVSSVTPESSIHTDVGGQDESPEGAKAASASEIASIQSSPANYTDEFPSASTIKSSPSDESRKTMQTHSVCQIPKKETTDSLVTKQTEPISDQSDIEGRIRALKEELKKRKFTAYQLKKEQKKRNKERLKAKEANLLKQLETYNDLIERTKTELNTHSEADTKSQIKDLFSSGECPSDQLPSHRSGSRKTSEPERIPILHHKDVTDLPDRSGSTSAPSLFSDEDPPTVTPTPRQGSPECLTLGHQSIDAHLEAASHSQKNEPGLEDIISEQGSEIQEEVTSPTSQKSEDQSSQCLLKLHKDEKMEPAQEPISHHSLSVNSALDKQIDTQQSSEANSVKTFVPVDRSADIKADPNISSVVHSVIETFKKDIQSSPISGGGDDDFESSVDSSLREQDYSKSAVATSVNHSEEKDIPTWKESHDEEIEEAIAEELSELSEASDGSQNYKIILDVNDKGQPVRPQNSVNSSQSPPLTPPRLSCTPVIDEMPTFNIGDRVVVSGVQPGTLRFKGPTTFANGFWAGVELDKSEGSNNGTYDGVLYFECTEMHGIFAPPDKITHLTDKFEIYTDTTEDDDSFFDDMSDNEKEDRKTKETKLQTEHCANEVFHKASGAGDNKATDDLVPMDNTLFKLENQEESKPVINGKSIWDSGDVSPTPLIEDSEKASTDKKTKTVITNVEKSHIDLNHHVSPDTKNDDEGKLGSLADKLLNNFVKETVQQFAEIKKAKAKKVTAANHMNGNVLAGDEEEDWVHQKDDLPFFLTQEKEELSSPELCNRPESPVLGASGQEELAKRLAELELSRELDDIGDDQDWFDEDFGLSSRREQQRLKQRREEEQAKNVLGKTISAAGTVIGGLVHAPSGEQQGKTPPRPELPLPMPPKLPEEPAMVVPHSATEVEKMVHAATLEIWKTCGLGEEGAVTLPQLQKPNPSHEYLSEEPHNDDQEAVCIHSYRKAVYDLTWEILQDIYAEDPNTYQPQWVKPQRARSSLFQRVSAPGDVTKVQDFISTEVLKLYGLTKDQNHKTDWPKMLKFGKKKRDRVDNILVQELHEEEAQWVNYDEDELFVKMQLADSIFEALLKDTANVLTQIYDKRAQGDGFS